MTKSHSYEAPAVDGLELVPYGWILAESDPSGIVEDPVFPGEQTEW